MKPIPVITCLFLLVQMACGQAQDDVANYIAKYKNIALEEMVRCKIPASITLAQGLHESSYGNSRLASEANNHFGIKCKDDWAGKKYYQNDDAPNECFRVYDQPEDSYADHSDFLITRSRYAPLFELPITDYKAWARGLKASGYATNPKYAEILIKTIEDYNLAQFDRQGIAMINDKEKLMQPAPVNEQMLVARNETVQNKVTAPSAPAPVKEEKHNTFAKAASTTFITVQDDAIKKGFTVNGCKAIKAEGTVDPLTVAFNYQIQYEQLLAFNDLHEGEKFRDGENIFLQSKKARGADKTYTPQSGESMRDIAQKFGIRLKDLYQKNLMALNDQPAAGEIIYLQEKRTAAPQTMAYSDFLKVLSPAKGFNNSAVSQANTSIDNSVPVINKPGYSGPPTRYTVQLSDTLYSIAKKFNTSVSRICVINNLDSPDLHPGQTLVIAQ